MKLGIAVSVGFWTAVAVWGFWGWATFCAVSAVVVWATSRKGV